MRAAGERLGKYPQSIRVRGNFAQMGELARAQGMDAVDGVLLDIGVSSYQPGHAGAGLFLPPRRPLDMRMSQEGPTARDLVNTLSQQELADIIFRYARTKAPGGSPRALSRPGRRRPLRPPPSWRRL